MSKDIFTVGIVGCGDISGIYCERVKGFNILNLAACADLDRAKAKARAAEFGIPRVMDTAALIADPGIDIVLNLTVPKAHFDIAKRAVAAGKHVYNEKPLCVELKEGKALMALAAKKRVLVGCAPDTFLGGGIQTCRKLIDDGVIGRPIGATAVKMCHGHESWHPSPEFYYEKGGGPMLDMGPYYLTALVNLLGPVARVCGSSKVSFKTRTITSKPKFGKVVKVETPTHIQAVLDFKSGASATIITSFDVWAAQLPCIEIYGEKGTLSVPDPNGFGGPVMLWKPDAPDWKEIPLSHGFADNYRGLGVADLAYAARDKRHNRASGSLALHVLEVMHAAINAGASGKYTEIGTKCVQPAPMMIGTDESVLAKRKKKA